jgi:putative SOS response-associated peptidase YedK
MPVILDKEMYDEWLYGDNEANLSEMLKPFAESRMKVYKVNTLVNSVKSEGPELIRPLSGHDLFSKD